MMKKTLLFILVLLFFLLPTRFANANSAPPPSVAWFTLDYETTQTPRLLGIQLIGCPTNQCEQPVLLQQYGICEAAGCVSLPATLSGFSTSFGCAGNKCRSSAFPNHGGSDFRLVAQFSDQVRSSDVVRKLPSSYGEVAAWQVIVRETDLSIQQDSVSPSISNPNQIMLQSPGWIGLSLLVEILVAAVCFQALARTDLRHLMGRLLIVLLVNLVSLPVVWLFFPSLGQFQSAGSRNFGMLILVAVGLYASLLVIIYRSTSKVRRWAITLGLLSLLVAGFGCQIILPLISYMGGYTVYAQGLPANGVILASEIFAVVFEALLITILTRRSLPARWIWITSLLMNAASFSLGLFLIRG